MNLRRIFSAMLISGTALLAGFALFTATPAMAQVDTGLQEVGETVKLSGTDPRVIATNIINWALGLIGIVLVVLILYAGFLYMTSGGEADKVEKAKKIIVNAIIGLVIILSAWGITRYVINALLSATQEGGGVGGGGGSGFVSGFGGGGAGTSFRVKSITPQGDSPLKPRNTEVKIVFTKSVDEASASGIAVIKDGGTTVGGTVKVEGTLVTFTPSQACPTPNESRKCFDGESGFQIKVANTVKSSSGQTITCGGFAPACTAHFSTSNLVDVAPPTVSITYPTDGMPVKVNSLFDVLASASDDSGVATVEFFNDGTSFGLDGPNSSNTPMVFDAKATWDTAGVALGTHSLSAEASDLDTNTAKSPSVSVVIRAEHCFNKTQDAGETGVDCGGDPNSPEYCGSCSGGTCTSNSQCSSGFCQNGKCVENPVIKAVEPLNGKAGTFVTLSGINFGILPGTITFLGGPSPADDKVAVAPQACVNLGSKVWTNTQAIVAVPEGAVSGPISIKNSSSGLTDRTDTDPGPKIADYLVDNSIHPGLCAIQPEANTVGMEVDAIGAGFGNTQGKIWFGSDDRQLSASPWSDAKAHFKIPVVNTGPYQVKVLTGQGASNAVEFEVLEKDLGQGPQLAAIGPATGPQQEYITLSGKYFGYNVGTVIFQGQGLEAVGDTSFPPACAAGFWRDDNIVIKVPSVFKNNQPTADGTYQVKVKRADGKESNSLEFQIDTKLQPKPGICAIDPAIGPEGTPVNIYGDRFGFDKPLVTFSSSKNAAVDSNTNQSVKTSVPKNAMTGPVTIIAQAQKSNSMNFQVKNCNEAPEVCGPPDKFQCCASGQCKSINDTCEAVSTKAEFAWQMSTGLIPLAPYVIEQCAPEQTPAPTPSPSPWIGRAGGDQAPIDAAIKMRFSQKLEQSSVIPANFKILKCTDTGSNPCAKTQAAEFALSLVAENDQQDVVTLKPSIKLDTSSTYSVIVSTNVKGKGETGANMIEMASCGKGPNNEALGYCFRFKTRASTEPTQIGAVNVVPNPFTFHETGVTEPYEAVPTDVNDKCIVLNCDLFNWAWSAGDTRGSISNDQAGNGYGKCVQKGMGNSETGDVPVDINAALVQTSLKGTGRMFVNFLPPQVTAHGPDCNIACSNALVWAMFSSKLDAASVSKPGNIVIRKCHNENCYESELDPPIQATGINLVGGTDIEIDHAVFEPGAFYFVLLRGGPNAVDPQTHENTGIKGLNGVPMTGTNHPNGFVWKFRVKTGADAFCKADRVDVIPVEKFETSVDGRQAFIATPFGKADECDPNGQKLVITGGAQWSTSDALVADFFKIDNDFVKTDRSKLPLGCTANCLATGAGGLYGKVAVCGNGVIETTDTNFCKTPPGQTTGVTPKGDACTQFAPGAKAGEECEPSIDGADMCDANKCLFKPVALSTVGGTCGNGTVDVQKGEACDFGLTCVGGSSATDTSPVPEFSPCNDAPSKLACETAHGTCTMHDYRGCSASCRHLGAQAGKSTCGNSDVLGDGKDCDDGNVTDGDGCSSSCLHEGSQSGNFLAAVCGNGKLEPGETCEGKLVNGEPQFPLGCDPALCLHTGVLACTAGETKNCCGNGLMEIGKDCDDGPLNGLTGCSKICLFQGSSPAYSSAAKTLSPSFCGNGILEAGEQCEVGASSDKVADEIKYPQAYAQDPGPLSSTVLNAVMKKKYGIVPDVVDRMQLAYIVGLKEPDEETGRSSSTLSAVLMDQTGKSTYGLQCGYTDESSCKDDDQNNPRGLDAFGCCRRRPYLTNNYPTGSGICRNVQVTLDFGDVMDSSSVVNNFQVDLKTSDPKCPDGTKEIAVAETPKSGLWNKVVYYWHKLVNWIMGGPAVAEKFCVGGVTGQLAPLGNPNGTTKFGFNLDHALAPNTTYRVRLTGDDKLDDNTDKNNRKGIKTKTGVVHDGDRTWEFTTNDKICAINVITISDTTGLHKPPEVEGQEHPFLFNNPGNVPEERFFDAQPQSIANGQAIPLSSTAEYQWTWQPWTSNNKDLVWYCGSFTLPEAQKSCFVTQQPSASTQLNGTAILTAGIKITNDTINVPSSTSATVYGSAPVVVLVCENPWPALGDMPFQDSLTWTNNAWAHGKAVSNLQSNTFTNPDPIINKVLFYNFSTMYCRDAGVEHKQNDDLPALAINPVPRTQIDQVNGILRQYLFTFGADRPDLKTDGIGVRIAENPMHLSPAEWYASKGFLGNPKQTLVDGYPALQDDNTLYIAAANQPDVAGSIYSNIYVISHNPDAKPETLEIYNQMVKYLAFNININGQSNTCHVVNGNQYSSSDVYLTDEHQPITCSADYECVAQEAGKMLFCDSNKAKMARDTVRMADFQSIIKKLGSQPGTYPQLTAGTFIKGLSNSIWKSWTEELSTGANAWPKDPVNRFVTCGRCEDGKPCQANSECAGQATDQTCQGGSLVNGSWVKNADIDPATCWNPKNFQYICPQYDSANPFSVSRLYQYQSFAGGTQYELSSEFEVKPQTAQQTDWWYPKLPTVMYKCANNDRYCMDAQGNKQDYLCRTCSNPANCKVCKVGGQDCTADAAVCNAPNDACQDVPSVKDVCRPIGGTFKYADICNNVALAEKGVCGDGVLNTGEFCELGETGSKSCTTAQNEPGHQQTSCTACTKYDIDPKHPQCVADQKCGNGRIDKHCSNNAVQGCITNVDCSGNADCVAAEACDDGVLNGSYGHCAVGCQGYGGYCGNGMMDAGETCDQGADNGKWSDKLNTNTCSFDCKGIGPYCGDQMVNGSEQCDGQSEQTPKAMCVGTSTPCDTDADCATNVECGSTAVAMNGHGIEWYKNLATTGKDIAASVLDHLLIPSAEAAPLNYTKLKSDPQINTQTYYNLIQLQKIGQQQNTIIPLQIGQNQPVIPLPGTPNTTCSGANAMSNMKYDDGKKHSVFASCAGLTYTGTDGIKRETQHVRTCKAPGSSSACQWNCWTECVPVGACGDGIKDANEECDDGGNNGDNKACLKSCRKNVCGDGFLNAAVEECDNGLQNGSPTCNADYNSSCLSCSQSCKWLASAGGYCGDGIKNGPEQCDGKDGLTQNNVAVTCKQLGYDYGWLGLATCANTCQYGGCKKCSEETGTGVIEGRVWDAVFLQVVPNARVSLMYKGIKTDEAFTDANGWFTFKAVNFNVACDSYRLVVDMYDDNVCTGVTTRPQGGCYEGNAPTFNMDYDLDEGALGGYHPYTSDIFSWTTYKQKIPKGEIYLFPRPENGRAYVAVNWNSFGQIGNITLHTILPRGFTIPGSSGNATEKTWNTCNWPEPTADGHHCTRDINPFRPGVEGNWDLGDAPYNRAICLHKAGEKLPGWSYDPATSNSGQDCPVEGKVQCLLNQGKGKTVDFCKTKNDADCLACGADITHADPNKTGGCSDGPNWENCRGVQFGPITSYVNYVPFNTGKIGFYLWNLDGDVSNMVKTKGLKAYLAVGDSLEIVQTQTGSGQYWHITDLDPAKGEFEKKNAFGSTSVTYPSNTATPIGPSNISVPDGAAYWNGMYQGGGHWCYVGCQERGLNTGPNTCPSGMTWDPSPTCTFPDNDWFHKTFGAVHN
ncbi:hypothetical protein HZC53_03970 [Candidatus Uhrbacteria bacterium]|nr:hypothetical protein [Candidatus Uhrbacteria bacterium]